jgi:membrane-bound lytic murein transglycosylase D
LRDLYAKYDDWCLALAAYNAGSGKVDKAIRRAGTRDFWQIARTRYLRRETRNFVPAILAATILAKSPGAYGLTEETDPPLEYDTAAVDSPTDLRVVAQCIDVSTAKIRDLNPCILQLQTPPESKSFDVHVPMGMGETFARELARIPFEKRLLFHRHKVRRGETLGQLARSYRTTVRAIQDANGMGRRTTIYAGRTLQIPARDMPEDHLADLHSEDGIQHRVRKGEFLGKIAQRYGVTVRQIQKANGISNASRIHAGDLLTIPKRPKRLSENDASSQDGSLEPKHVASGAGAGVPGNVSLTPKQQSHPLRAKNTSDSLGRVPTTAHIVEDAREAIKEEESVSPPKSRVHVVRKGDTLSDIAAQYGVRLSSLRHWNNLGRRSRIYPGQEIMVRDPGTRGGAPGKKDFFLHIVKSGESLWKIAGRYGVRVMDLVRWNNLRRSAIIHPGQSLRIY